MKGVFYLDSLNWIDLSQLPSLLFLPVCILTVSLIIGIMLNNMVEKRLHQHVSKIDESSLIYIIIQGLRGIPINFSLVVGLYWIVNTSSLPDAIVKLFSYILFTSIVFTITRFVERVLSRLVELKLSAGSNETEQSTLLSMIFKGIVYSTGLLIILDYYDISIASIITALGVGGMAVAFGLQETLANIFSGLQLILSRQVRVGDYIRLNTGDEGNLEHVETVTLETALKVMAEVDGYEPALDENGIDTNPMAPAVRFHTFADSSINFNVILHSPFFGNQYIIKHKFIKELTKRYKEENINIPFPIRTIINPQN